MGAIPELSLAERIAQLEKEILYDEPRALNIGDAMRLAEKRQLLEKLKRERVAEIPPTVSAPPLPPARKRARVPVRERRVVALRAPVEPVLSEPVKAAPPAEPSIEQYAGERWLTYRHPDSGRPTGKMMTWEEAVGHQKAGRLIIRKRE